jgi:hypothetical protein
VKTKQLILIAIVIFIVLAIFLLTLKHFGVIPFRKAKPAPGIIKKGEIIPYQDNGSTFTANYKNLTLTLNYGNKENASQLDLTVKTRGVEEITLQNWMPSTLKIERLNSNNINADIVSRGKPEITVTQESCLIVQNFTLTSNKKEIPCLITLKRTYFPASGDLFVDWNFNNQGTTPCLIRTTGMLLTRIPRYYKKGIISYDSGLITDIKCDSMKTGYLAFFEDPLKISFENPKTGESLKIYSTDKENKRFNLGIQPDKYIFDYMTDPINQVLTTHDINNPEKSILSWIQTGKAIRLTHHILLPVQAQNPPQAIYFAGWYPKGYDTAFCLQADEIKPDVETPKTAENRYKAVEEVMLGKLHQKFPQMKMQAIVVVDDMNPNNKDTHPLDNSPWYHGENDLLKNPEDVKRYQEWLKKGKGFFKLQSHAVHHTPSNKPGGQGYTQAWEFDPTDEHGSGKYANDPVWVKAMISRLKSEMESCGLGTQTYFKPAGYRRSYPLAQVLAEEGYKVWDYNPTVGSNISEIYHLRYRYISPQGKHLWIIGSGPALELKKSEKLEDYWNNINRQLSRGYPLITSGHLEWLNDSSILNILSDGWGKMYRNYHVWNAWPDELADYWDKRQNLEIIPQTEDKSGLRIILRNHNDTSISGATLCCLIEDPALEKAKNILIDGKPSLNYRYNKTMLSIWTDIPANSEKSIVIQP